MGKAKRQWTTQGADLFDPDGKWRGTLCDAVTARTAAVALTAWTRRHPPLTAETVLEPKVADQDLSRG